MNKIETNSSATTENDKFNINGSQSSDQNQPSRLSKYGSSITLLHKSNCGKNDIALSTSLKQLKLQKKEYVKQFEEYQSQIKQHQSKSTI